jgi:hypothetical protein
MGFWSYAERHDGVGSATRTDALLVADRNRAK